jgi:glucosamine-6-phosphate deaminase
MERDDMIVKVLPDSAALAAAAAADAGKRIRDAIAARGRARIIAATGASQIAFLGRLVREPDIDWSKVEMFHLDEYVGLPKDHPASFRKYLLERLIRPAGITNYHFLDGERDPNAVCREVGAALTEAPVDVALVGIGENGHLAFNDPPADFETDAPYILVRLDERCRQQQVGEGWFASVADVPETAISMSVRQILRARAIVCVVPDARKAEAVRATIEGAIGPMIPASILRTHPDVAIYLDEESASLLESADE